MPVGGDHKRHGRRTPYTEIGITRLPCFRCGRRPGAFQWNVCADFLDDGRSGPVYRVLCVSCDVAMNAMVLRWMRDPDAETKIRRYRAKLEGDGLHEAT